MKIVISNIISKFEDLSLSALDRVLLVWIIAVSLLLTLLVPPLQKPDEYVHFQRAVALKNGFIFCSSSDNKYQYDNKYLEVQKSVDQYSLTQNYSGKYYYKEYIKPIFSSNPDKTKTGASHICGLPVISYIVPSFSLLLSDMFQLNGIYGFYLGRLANLTLFYVVIFQIIKNTKNNFRTLLLSLLGLPILLHQVGSYSYDSIHLSFGFLVIAWTYVLSIYKNLEVKKYIYYLLLFSAFIFSKAGGYELMFILPLIPLVGKITLSNFRSFLSHIVSYLLLALAYLFVKLKYLSIFTNTNSYELGVHPNLQIKYLMQEPFSFIVAFWNSHEYLTGLAYSFIGTLGWLDYRLSEFVYFVYFLIIVYIFFKYIRGSKPKLHPLQYLGFFIAGFGVYTFIHLLMYISWTKVGGDIIVGTQARYFLITLPLLLISFRSIYTFIRSNKTYFYSLVFSLLFISLARSVFLRYYDYASLQDSPQTSSFYQASAEDSSKEQVVFKVNPNKKLSGLNLYFNKVEKEIYKPHRYLIQDSNCKNTLSDGFIHFSDIQEDDYTKIDFKPIESQSDELCITIFNYANENSKQLNISQVHIINLR